MAETIEIPLHAGRPPGLGQVFGWVIAANVFVLVTVGLFVVVLPWLGGQQPRLDGSTLMISGGLGFVLMVGFLFVAFRRHQAKLVAIPSAHLVLTADRVELRPVDGEPAGCPRDEFVAEPVHAHEVLRGVDYYMGPALDIRVGATSLVVGYIDGARRWNHDPRAVQKIDWICASDAWEELLRSEDLADALVPYEPLG